MKTIHDRLVEELVRRGAEVVPYVTERYTALSWTSGGRTPFFFVSRNGSLRFGPTITESHPVPPAFEARLLAGTAASASKDGHHA
jgi:hypothetical protein